MPREIFGPALKLLPEGQWGLYGPTSFQDYLKRNSLPRTDTAQAISVDFLDKLDPQLRQRHTMVLRLGAATDGPGTQFALISAPGRLEDFFLDDGPDQAAEPFMPEWPPGSQIPYTIFPILTETSLVNLAFASGLIGCTLGLDRPYPTAAPATGASTYTFRFRPHSSMPDELEHARGQVEIDAVFTGRRGGRPCLFILEAKSGAAYSGLAKHKLVYPLLALAPRVAPDTQLVPVYLRIAAGRTDIRYTVTECRYPDPRGGITCLNDLEPVTRRTFTLSI